MNARLKQLIAPALAVMILGGTATFGTSAVAQSKSSKSKKSATSQKKTSSRKSSSKSKSKSSKAKSGGNRLPAYYGQVDLKDEQRQEIYDIQGNYKSKIEKLEKELADLREKMNKDMEGVLTRTQKSKLKKLRSGSATKSSSSSKSSSSRSKSSKSRSTKKK